MFSSLLDMVEAILAQAVAIHGDFTVKPRYTGNPTGSTPREPVSWWHAGKRDNECRAHSRKNSGGRTAGRKPRYAY